MPGIVVLYNWSWWKNWVQRCRELFSTIDAGLLEAMTSFSLHQSWQHFTSHGGRENHYLQKLSLFGQKTFCSTICLFSFRLVVLTVVLAGVELDGGEDCQVKTPLDGINDSFCSFQVSSSLLLWLASFFHFFWDTASWQRHCLCLQNTNLWVHHLANIRLLSK